jgi:RsiW-degrading membrane proteinase PrsW (M82 family)
MTALVTLVMLVFYATVLLAVAKKTPSDKGSVLVMVAMGLAFGFISYDLIVPFNGVESRFMDTTGILHAILFAPIQEEAAKFVNLLVALVFIFRNPLRFSGEGSIETQSFRSLIILGSLVGLGFATTENLIDYGNLSMIATFERTVMTWPLHMLSVAISAYGFHKYRTTRKLRMITVFLLTAIIVHMLFNLSMILLHPF